ncbi:carbohydrate ABC transporter permease, partial [Streptomyces anulatus]|uniref:carbohydrate ABC transporter permease n=1 Tax=Streptomyces anulatus TaxID=1892 RepID=UPI0034174D8E
GSSRCGTEATSSAQLRSPLTRPGRPEKRTRPALLLYAGMLQIPAQVYEAAAIDGAGEIRTFFRVTLPLLRPILALVLVVSVIGCFQIFDTIAVATKGGPINATKVIYYYIYQEAFTHFRMGYASAMALSLVLVLGTLTYLQMRLMRASSSDLG